MYGAPHKTVRSMLPYIQHRLPTLLPLSLHCCTIHKHRNTLTTPHQQQQQHHTRCIRTTNNSTTTHIHTHHTYTQTVHAVRQGQNNRPASTPNQRPTEGSCTHLTLLAYIDSLTFNLCATRTSGQLSTSPLRCRYRHRSAIDLALPAFIARHCQPAAR